MNDRTHALTVVLLLSVVALMALERFGVIPLPFLSSASGNCPDQWTPTVAGGGTDGPTFGDLDVVARNEVIPSTPAGEQLEWVLQALHGRYDVSEEEIREHFAPSALEALPADEMIDTLSGFRGHAPLGFIGLREGATPLGFSAVFQASPRGFAEVVLHVSEAPPHQMTALLVQPYDPSVAPTPGPELPPGFGLPGTQPPNPPTTDTPGVPTPGTPAGDASIPAEAVQSVIAANEAAIESCYNAGLADNPELSGTLTVSFDVLPGGQVASASVASSDLGAPDVEACIIAAALTWSFPPPLGGVVTVTYPFQFAPQ